MNLPATVTLAALRRITKSALDETPVYIRKNGAVVPVKGVEIHELTPEGKAVIVLSGDELTPR